MKFVAGLKAIASHTRSIMGRIDELHQAVSLNGVSTTGVLSSSVVPASFESNLASKDEPSH